MKIIMELSIKRKTINRYIGCEKEIMNKNKSMKYIKTILVIMRGINSNK